MQTATDSGLKTERGDSAARAIAPASHTWGLIVGLLALSVAGAVRSPISEWPETLGGSHSRLFLYARMLMLQAVWVGYVFVGMRRSATPVRALLGRSPLTGRHGLRYLAIGLSGWILWLGVGAGLAAVLRPSDKDLAGLAAMLPKNPAETWMWVFYAMVAGTAEEFVYRGYLLRQIRAWTGSTLIAVVLQAVVYASAHLVLPIEMVVSTGLLGILLGTIAVWQKSLVPAMIAHVAVGLMAAAASGA